MKILITGANGFVGLYVCKQLLQNGHTVIATGKGNCRLPFITHPGFIYRMMDFTDAAATAAILTAEKPAVVIHSGAISKPDQCEREKELAYTVNVTGTENLLKAAKKNKAFFIFLSTDFIFDGKRGMYREDDAPGPVNYYGQTKLLAEEQVKKYPHKWSIIRTVLVYGPPMPLKPTLLSIVKEKLEKGTQYRVVDDQFRTPTYVEDLAAAIAAVAERKTVGVFHIAGPEVFTPYLLACKAALILGLDASLIIRTTTKTLREPAIRPSRTGFTIDKAKNLLGYNPVSFETGLTKSFSQK